MKRWNSRFAKLYLRAERHGVDSPEFQEAVDILFELLDDQVVDDARIERLAQLCDLKVKAHAR